MAWQRGGLKRKEIEIRLISTYKQSCKGENVYSGQENDEEVLEGQRPNINLDKLKSAGRKKQVDKTGKLEQLI